MSAILIVGSTGEGYYGDLRTVVNPAHLVWARPEPGGGMRARFTDGSELVIGGASPQQFRPATPQGVGGSDSVGAGA